MVDFFEALEGLSIKFLIYADDIFMYHDCVSLESSRVKLQKTLRFIMQWRSYWKLSIRPDKCQTNILSRKLADCEFNFSVNGRIIE